jgi:signal peptidase I
MGKEKKQESSWEMVRSFTYAILLALFFRSVAYEPFHIPSGSMLPTLNVGDYIFVSKFSYGYSRYSFPFGARIPYFQGRIFAGEPKRGDIIVFRTPQDPRIDYIKRLVGLPGDQIQMVEGVLYVNGMPVSLRKIAPYREARADGSRPEIRRYEETLPGGRVHQVLDEKPYGNIDMGGFDSDNTSVYTVPEGHFFFMGDNRDNSLDSRFDQPLGVGFVPIENLVGRAEMIFFSYRQNVRFWEFWRWPEAFDNSRWFKVL